MDIENNCENCIYSILEQNNNYICRCMYSKCYGEIQPDDFKCEHFEGNST